MRLRIAYQNRGSGGPKPPPAAASARRGGGGGSSGGREEAAASESTGESKCLELSDSEPGAPGRGSGGGGWRARPGGGDATAFGS